MASNFLGGKSLCVSLQFCLDSESDSLSSPVMEGEEKEESEDSESENSVFSVLFLPLFMIFQLFLRALWT